MIWFICNGETLFKFLTLYIINVQFCLAFKKKNQFYFYRILSKAHLKIPYLKLLKKNNFFQINGKTFKRRIQGVIPQKANNLFDSIKNKIEQKQNRNDEKNIKLLQL